MRFNNTCFLIILLSYSIALFSKEIESTSYYNCQIPMDCFKLANKYLDDLDQMAGQDYSNKRFVSEDQANLAAAKKYGPAASDSFREPNWIVFKDNNYEMDAYGFTYPAVSKSYFRKSKKAAVVFDLFTFYINDKYQARTLGHVHYDDNDCFSATDLLNYIRKNGKFILLTRSGNLRYITYQILKDDYKVYRGKHLRKHIFKTHVNNTASERYFYNRVLDPSICGKYIGNIYETKPYFFLY